jgi:NitT/TauT family transport system substrate-binding protein
MEGKKMRLWHRLLVLVLLSFFILPLAAGCKTSNTPTPKARKVIVNYGKGNYTTGTFIIMRAEKLLEKYLPEGVTIEWTNLTGGPEMRDAMITRDIHITSSALMTIITSLENDIPFRIISYCSVTPTKVYAGKETASLDALGPTGKITLTNLSTNLHMAFLAYCKETYAEANRFGDRLVAMPNAEGLAALTTGTEIKASIFTFPVNLKAEADPSLHMIADMTDVVIEYGIGSACYVLDDYYKENPDIVAAFLKAQKDAVDIIVSRPEHAAQIMIDDGLGADVAEIVSVIATMPPTPTLTEDMYDKSAALIHEAGIMDHEPKKLSEFPFFKDLD